MRIIKNLANQIKDEVEDADKYLECSLKYEDEYSEMAKLYASLAEEELGHADRLHSCVVVFIKKKRSSGVEPPRYMLEMWEEEHKEIVDKVATIKHKLSIVKSKLG